MSRFISLSSTSRIFAIQLLLYLYVPRPDTGRSPGSDSLRREPDGKDGSHPQRARNRNLTPHHLTEALANRQPEPRATVFACHRDVGLDERLEQLLYLLGGHANAGVGHPERDPCSPIDHLTGDLQGDGPLL